MGAYLSTPETTKESEEGKLHNGFVYGASSMQGWRRSQEDAHLISDLPDGTTVFGVFDGHGGREVSAFAKLHFAEVLVTDPNYSTELGAALKASFHGVDMLLEDEANLVELESLKRGPHEQAGPSSAGVDASADANADASSEGKRVSLDEAVDLFSKLISVKRDGSGGGGIDGATAAAAAAAPGKPAAILTGDSPRASPQACTLPPSHVDAGATAVVAAVRGKQLYVANAGDSRAILSRRGKAIALSSDHKPALPTELSRIEKAGGWVTAQGRINGNLNL
jgi:protein phosphatase 1G